MNKLCIIGNLTRAPEAREVNGLSCATFTVAVNRRVKEGQHPQADFIRVTTWQKLAENCIQYLDKGRKVYCEGPVRASAWTSQQGELRASLEMTANSVEFLTPKGAIPPADTMGDADAQDDFDDDELPF